MIIEYTVCIVLCGVIAIGVLSGVLGVFVLLRGQGLLGDAIAHAALPGIALALLLTRSSSQIILLFGGICSGSIGMALVSLITRRTRLKRDAAQGVVLSIFFGCGLVLLTIIQKGAFTQQPLLNTFLFGNIATLLEAELCIILLASINMIITIGLFWKEMVACVFDGAYMHSIGFNDRRILSLLSIMLLAGIVIGIQSVGVILMSTMLIAPAAAARQWTSCLKNMVFLASFFGAFSGVIGVLVSHSRIGMPTGPTIVVVASMIACVSIICAPIMYAIRIKKITRWLS